MPTACWGPKLFWLRPPKPDRTIWPSAWYPAGGSSLLALPADGITLAEKQATIHEINKVRKHLSAVKGGRLAQAAYPAIVLTLILSDVVGDDLDAIASGPTVPDPSTFAKCLTIVERYGIAERLPGAVMNYLTAGTAGRMANPRNAQNRR